MTKAVAIANPAPVPAQPVSWMELIDRAMTNGANMDVIKEFMTLHERHEVNQARKAFNEAIAAAKAQIGPITKNRTGHNGKYADIGAIAKAIDNVLSEHGLGYRYRAAQADRITVTCILFHKLGHCEETTLSGPPDTSGSKNAIQAIGSTASYLERYTLIMALGLAVSNDDDDGKSVHATEVLSDEQVREVADLLTMTGSNLASFLKVRKVSSITDILAVDFDAVIKLINETAEKRNAKKAEAFEKARDVP